MLDYRAHVAQKRGLHFTVSFYYKKAVSFLLQYSVPMHPWCRILWYRRGWLTSLMWLALAYHQRQTVEHDFMAMLIAEDSSLFAGYATHRGCALQWTGIS